MLLKKGNKYVEMEGLEHLPVLFSIGVLDVIAVNRRGKQFWYLCFDRSEGKYYYLRERDDGTLNHKGVRLDIYAALSE